jgi:hypothetical protein
VTWLPDPQVTIGTASYGGSLVSSVSVRRGRADVDSSTSAGQCTVVLQDTAGAGFPIEVGQSLGITVDDSGGSAVQVFGGQIETLELSSATRGGGTPIYYWTAQATGPIARLNRRQALFGGRPQELDGARVAAAIAAGLAQSWEEYDATEAWSAVGSAVTWNTVDEGYDAALIDPGLYSVAALGSADAGYGALQVAQNAATSGLGMLYETADGFIGYADADRRPANAEAGYLQVPASSLAASGLRLQQRLDSVVNRLTLDYDGGSITVSDLSSIQTYGLWQSSLTTQLADVTAGSAVASEFVVDRRDPRYELDAIEVNLLSVGTALRDSLLQTVENDALTVSGIPAGLGFTSFSGFVEGLTFSVNRSEAMMTLNVSDTALSIGPDRWSYVTGTLTWADLPPTLQWQDARSL